MGPKYAVRVQGEELRAASCPDVGKLGQPPLADRGRMPRPEPRDWPSGALLTDAPDIVAA